MHGCGRCGGLWLDNEGSEAITRHADPRVLRLADRADERAKQQPRPTHDEPLSCPVCATMEKVSPARIAQLDICPDHGTWFDPGELRRVATVFQNRSNDDVLAPIIDPIEGHRRASAAAASASGGWQDGPAADAAFEGATKLVVGVGVDIAECHAGCDATMSAGTLSIQGT